MKKKSNIKDFIKYKSLVSLWAIKIYDNVDI